MTRKDKLKLLQAANDGKLNLGSLQPPTVYHIHEREPGIYEMKGEGRDLSEKEYLEFCKEVEERNRERINLGLSPGNDFTKEDTIITFLHPDHSSDIEPGKQPISLVIS